jgi:hypothetical protein
MRAGTALHAHQRCRHVRGVSQQLLARELLASHDLAVLTECDQMKRHLTTG